MAVPGTDSIRRCLLEVLDGADVLRIDALRHAIRQLLDVDDDDLVRRGPRGRNAFDASVSRALYRLKASGLITSPSRGNYAITASGRALLSHTPFRLPVVRSLARSSFKRALPTALLLKAASQVPVTAEERFVQCAVIKPGARSRPVKRLAPRQNYLARTHIGSEVDDDTLRADTAFDESLLPPSEVGHDLQVVFCPLDTSAARTVFCPARCRPSICPKRDAAAWPSSALPPRPA